jgi:4-carboxymuconolactone decarboxylase
MKARAKPRADRLARGKRKLQEIHGAEGEAVVAGLARISPDLARYIVEFAFGDVYSRKGLSARERQIATVAGLVALGHAQPQLKSHIRGALNVGCRRKEVLEIIIQLAVYAGFPAAFNAAVSAREVFAERDARGLKN